MIIDRLHPIFQRFRAAANEGTDLGGDRGDDFVPTDDEGASKGADDVDSAVAKAAEKAAAEKAAAEKAGKGEKADKTDETDPEHEDDADKGKKDGRKDSRIPISRHKDILEKERLAREDAERQLAQYKNGDRVVAMNDDIKKAEDSIAKLDEEYTKLVTDGDHEKAATKMREIRRLERDLGDLKSDFKANVASTRAVEKVRYDTAVDRLEEAYPVLNPQNEDHDAELAQEVLDLAVTYQQRRGMSPSEAIQRAAKRLLGTETNKQEKATSVTPRVNEDDPEVQAERRRAAKEEERRKAQVAKNVDVAGKQPADLSKTGMDSDKAGGAIDARSVMKMSYEDFGKLNEADLARLRGDTFAES